MTAQGMEKISEEFVLLVERVIDNTPSMKSFKHLAQRIASLEEAIVRVKEANLWLTSFDQSLIRMHDRIEAIEKTLTKAQDPVPPNQDKDDISARDLEGNKVILRTGDLCIFRESFGRIYKVVLTSKGMCLRHQGHNLRDYNPANLICVGNVADIY